MTPKSAHRTQRRLVEWIAMSGLEASSNEALELKEEKDFDVELEGNPDFDYGRDPFEYLFYR